MLKLKALEDFYTKLVPSRQYYAKAKHPNFERFVDFVTFVLIGIILTSMVVFILTGVEPREGM